MGQALLFGMKRRILLSGVLTSSTLAGALYSYNYYQEKQAKTTLSYVLEQHYQIKKGLPQNSLRLIMKEAGVSDIDYLLDSRNANLQELGSKMLKFIQAAQENCTKRKQFQERWQLPEPEPKELAKQLEIIYALRNLGLLDEVTPTAKECDAILFLGSTYPTMQHRMNFLEGLYNSGQLKAKYLYILVGERYTSCDKNGKYVDGSEEELLALAQEINKPITKLTETDFARKILQNSSLHGKLEIIIIDTPKRDLPRPTTQTTVALAYQDIPKRKDLKNLTGASNQPHVLYQKEVVGRVLHEETLKLVVKEFKAELTNELDEEEVKDLLQVSNPEITKRALNAQVKLGEVVGLQYAIEGSPQEIAVKIQYVISALGSWLWAATPRVLEAIGLDLASEPTLAQGFAELYKAHPLVYQGANSNNLKPKPRN